MTDSKPAYQPTVCPTDRISIGLGDRLGNAGSAHLKLLQNYNVFPVLAQQSMRELSLTNRTYADVVEAAREHCLEAGWERGFGADGDHLKKAVDIRTALDAGCSMITLDCSDEFPQDVKRGDAYWAELNNNKQTLYRSLYEEYEIFLKQHDWAGEMPAEAEFMDTVAFFDPVTEFIVKTYREIIATAERAIDFEVSIDETSFETKPFAHWLLGGVMQDAGVEAFSVAPRFNGAFEKGIDYIGDLDAFRNSLRRHEAIARHYGYRLSIHSGSDKYSIFPIIADEIDRPYHLKTAGTHWLVAVELVAETNPQLFRKLYQLAEKSFLDAKKLYVIETETVDIAAVDSFDESGYPRLLSESEPHYRQFFHVNYGALLNDQAIHDGIYRELAENKDRYHELLNINLGKHLDKLALEKNE